MPIEEIKIKLKQENISATVKLINNNIEIRVKYLKDYFKVIKLYPMLTITYSSIK